MQIIVDYRERSSGLIELLQESLEVEIRYLPHGDYLLNGRIIVERKTARDFLISIVDQRLFRQTAKLKGTSLWSVLLIEGNLFHTGLCFSPEAIKGALLSLQAIWQLPIVFTRTREETRDALVTICRQEKISTDVVPLRGGYRPRRLKTRQLYLLQGLPGIGPVLAKRLHEHFGSPNRIMAASMDDLAEVKGMGPEKAQLIREVLDAEE